MLKNWKGFYSQKRTKWINSSLIPILDTVSLLLYYSSVYWGWVLLMIAPLIAANIQVSERGHSSSMKYTASYYINTKYVHKYNYIYIYIYMSSWGMHGTRPNKQNIAMNFTLLLYVTASLSLRNVQYYGYINNYFLQYIYL